MSQALYRKWRPHLWDEVVGQEHVVQTLKNAIQAGKVGHAYLFAGPRGTGKTTTARLLAKAVNCLDPEVKNRPCDKCENCIAVNENRFMDLIEIDAASNTGVDDIRGLREKVNFSPSKGEFKVYIIDEVHMLSNAAFNALLKTLEEPPLHVIFILATTEVHRILATVLSRCQRHEFRRIPQAEIVELLTELAKKEGIKVEAEALALIARQATGSMRDAISMLDQLQSMGQKVTLAMAQDVLGTAASQTVIDLMNKLLAQQAGEGMRLVHKALDGGTDPRQFARQMVDYLRQLMLIKMGNMDQIEATKEVRKVMEGQAAEFEIEHLLSAIRAFQSAAGDTSTGWLPGLMLELAIAKVAAKEQAQTQSNSEVHHTPVVAASTAEPKSMQAQVVKTPVSEPVQPETITLQAAAKKAVESAPSRKDENLAAYQAVIPNWKKIREVVKKKKAQTEGLLNSIRSMMMKGDQLILGFGNDLLKSKMEVPENCEITRQAIHEVVGVDVRIVCVIASTKSSGSITDLGVESDGLVSNAINQGGKVKKVE